MINLKFSYHIMAMTQKHQTPPPPSLTPLWVTLSDNNATAEPKKSNLRHYIPRWSQLKTDLRGKCVKSLFRGKKLCLPHGCHRGCCRRCCCRCRRRRRRRRWRSLWTSSTPTGVTLAATRATSRRRAEKIRRVDRRTERRASCKRHLKGERVIWLGFMGLKGCCIDPVNTLLCFGYCIFLTTYY